MTVSDNSVTVPHFRSTSATQGETMATGKTAILSFRIEPGLKDALRTAAEQEHRSIANMVEVMIREYCEKIGVDTTSRKPKASEKSSSKRIK